jgi:predicted AAA+ superfamily ATPase
MGEDKSKLYENIVFLHLRRQTKDLYYFKQNQEVDFYARIESKEYLINVSYIIEDEKTRKRELDGLLEAMAYFKLSEAYLITKNEESVVKIENKTIFIKPLYKYLLED